MIRVTALLRRPGGATSTAIVSAATTKAASPAPTSSFLDERDATQRRAQREGEVAEHHDERARDDHLAPAAPVGDPAGRGAEEQRADAARADGDPNPDVAGRELVSSVERQHEEQGAERRERAQVPRSRPEGTGPAAGRVDVPRPSRKTNRPMRLVLATFCLAAVGLVRRRQPHLRGVSRRVAA